MNLLLASTSTVHGSGYLEYLNDVLRHHFRNSDSITFVPYARPGGISYDDYTHIASTYFDKLGLPLRGIHQMNSEEIGKSQGIFVGGGNSFVLLKTLHETGMLSELKALTHAGIPYLGTSAGANIAGTTIMTTNDMPVVNPGSFHALDLVPFQINPHYQDPDPETKHMGETRETRIREFHVFNDIPVLGIREGAYVHVQNGTMRSEGTTSIRLFEQGKDAIELHPGSDLDFLLT